MALFDFLKKKELEEIEKLKKVISGLEKYRGIADADKHIHGKLEELENLINRSIEERGIIESEIYELRNVLAIDQERYNKLKQEIALLTESLELSEYGVNEPNFEFNTSDIYKGEISNSRYRQKELILNNRAIEGGEQIMWNESYTKSLVKVKQVKKLMLRAFNCECDSLISTVKWNNLKKLRKEFINPMKPSITYLKIRGFISPKNTVIQELKSYGLRMISE